MDEEQLRKHAEWEDEATKNVTGPMSISPTLLEKLAGMEEIVKERNKQKQHFFYVVLQDTTGKIINISHHNDYETALMWGMDKAKETGTYWSTYALNGKFVDGNYIGR